MALPSDCCCAVGGGERRSLLSNGGRPSQTPLRGGKAKRSVRETDDGEEYAKVGFVWWLWREKEDFSAGLLFLSLLIRLQFCSWIPVLATFAVLSVVGPAPNFCFADFFFLLLWRCRKKKKKGERVKLEKNEKKSFHFVAQQLCSSSSVFQEKRVFPLQKSLTLAKEVITMSS